MTLVRLFREFALKNYIVVFLTIKKENSQFLFLSVFLLSEKEQELGLNYEMNFKGTSICMKKCETTPLVVN